MHSGERKGQVARGGANAGGASRAAHKAAPGPGARSGGRTSPPTEREGAACEVPASVSWEVETSSPEGGPFLPHTPSA